MILMFCTIHLFKYSFYKLLSLTILSIVYETLYIKQICKLIENTLIREIDLKII